MEMSHRGKEFISIAEGGGRSSQAARDSRGYRALPARRASLQFEMIPMNLIQGRAVADYINTGEWAKKAINAAKSGRCQRGCERGGSAFTYAGPV